MVAIATRVQNSDRMMISAEAHRDGIAVAFADGCRGVIPFAEISELGGTRNLKKIALPNPYELLLHPRKGEPVEIPWDFARSYCDVSYRPRIEAAGSKGRQTLGDRIRQLRTAAGLTQDELAASAGIGRVTLVRIERGEQSPRYETLLALAKAMQQDPRDLLTGGG